ncbi:restriction endonuclease protein [Marine Group I thaumarchaeote SCGC RSA3]|uniref:Mrr restriction system protein n=2 Tax=Marine Group I TaxID=905826 RepID=A0A087RLN7_9ARCH|nr:Mrr restriction system protein [Marine Group I thaumarchaeote SCGC AAA799-D11]KFM21004.1 restriction endonuclease protein [Marine Group I thaumarchaeote SCGC RSA3]
MAYPPESQVRLPLLRFAKDGKLKSVLDAEKYLSKRFKLTNAEINRTKKSGNERLFLHRVRWSRTILKYSGLVSDPKTGFFKITPGGLKILKNPPPVLNDKFLSQFPEFKKWRRRKK